MEVSYATSAIRKRCLGPDLGGLEEGEMRALRGFLADLRATYAFSDSPWSRFATTDPFDVDLANGALRIRATIQHAGSPSDAGRIKIISVEQVRRGVS